MARVRGYCFTINNWSDDDVGAVMQLAEEADYLVVGFEVGKKKTPHMQGYVFFRNKRTKRTVSDVIHRAYLAAAKGTPQQNRAYCIKDGDYYEQGEVPQQGMISMAKLEEVMKNPQEYPHLYKLYKKTYQDIKQHEIKNSTDRVRFFLITPVADAITEIYEYFNWVPEDNVAIVTELSQLEAYPQVDRVVLFTDHYERLYDLWSRGVPISYKFGYEVRVVRPKVLVIVTETPNLYSNIYKRIC